MTDNREKILVIAEELFAEYGFEGTSIRELAKKAKVNIAMISYYFGSKEDLMKELIKSRAGSFRPLIENISHSKISCMKKMDMLIEVWVDRIFRHSKFHRVLNREISLQQRSKFNGIVSDIMLGNFEEIKKIINEGHRKKEFRKVDVDLTIATLIGTISKIVLSPFLSSRILKLEFGAESLFDEKHKTRLKTHLKDLMRAHLILSK